MLLVLVLGVGASFAADSNQTDLQASDDTDTVVSITETDTVSSNDDEVYSAGNDSSVISATAGSFTELSTLINSSTTGAITLDKDYTYNSATDSAFVNGIIINRTISIDGNGKTISGNNAARIFDINGNNVLLRDINFINGKSTDYGALIWRGTNGYLVASTFQDNYATATVGAVYWLGAYGTISDCTFTGNHANHRGAIYVTGTEVTITKCKFENNYANDYYGAGRIDGSYNVVSYCVFNNNYAGSYAGALRWGGTQGKLLNCNFTNNHAKYDGALLHEGTYGTIDNCLFENNYATLEQGAVYTTQTTAMITNSIFKNNTGSDWGGALRCNGGQSSVINCYFEGNSVTASGSHGGALYQGSNLIVESSTFINNHAEWGGAIYGDDIYFTLNNLTFKNNKATQYGGALNIKGGMIFNSLFEGNSATGFGGAIRSRDNAPYIENNTFIRNNATDGGAVYIPVVGSYLYNNTFNYNTATNNGGGINIAANNVYLGKSTFTGNKANKLGGGVYDSGNQFSLDGATFTGNTATDNSGAIYIVSGKSVYLDYTTKTSSDTVNAANIVNMPKTLYIQPGGTGTGETSATATNWADAFSRIATGGIIYFKKGIYTDIRGVTLNKNINLIGLENDVVINLENANRAFMITAPCSKIDNIDFKNGNKDNGGAIHVSNAWFTYVSNCYFENNYATSNGGAIYMYGRHGTVINCTFYNNRAKTNGGGYFSGAYIQSIINCKFIGGSAQYGGGVYYSSTNSEIINCEFTQNTATVNGGGVYWSLQNGTIQDCTFNKNSAVKGGAIYWAQQDGTVLNCQFLDNDATDGGALYTTGIRMNVEGSNFTNNSASGNGGAVYSTGRETSVSDSDFNGNDATKGGAISSNGVKGSVTNSSFENNAAENGSAIIIGDGLDISISNSEFSNNEGNGSVYIPEGSSFKIENNTFENNTGGDIETPGVVSAEILYASVGGTGTGLTEDDPTDWQQAIENVIEGGIVYLLPGTYSMADLITIEKSVSIKGLGSGVVLNNYARGQLFSIKANNVILGNIEFRGISGNYIVWDGTNGKIESCKFDGSSTNSNSKLISTSVLSNVFTVSKSNFIGFKYNNLIYTTNYGTTVEDCIFQSNTPYSSSSYLIDFVGSDSNIINSQFTSNTAKLVNVESAANRALISGTTFTGNVMGSGNSMIYINSQSSTISCSTFKNSNTGGTYKYIYGTESFALSGNTFEGVTASLNSVSGVTYPNNPTVSGTFNYGVNRANTIPVTANSNLLPNVARSSDATTFSYTWDTPLPNSYTLTFATTDSEGNKYTYTSTPNSVSTTVNRISTVYISPDGTGTGASASDPTNWDNVANLLTDTGSVVFTAGTYKLNGKTISKSWKLSNSGTVIFDAENKGRIFTITANSVSITGITFKNGKVSNNQGSAISWTGTGGSINNAVFTENTGVPISSSNDITIKNTQMKNQISLTKSNINWGAKETINATFTHSAPSTVTVMFNGASQGSFSVSSKVATATVAFTNPSTQAVGSYVVTDLKNIYKEVL